MKTMNILSLFDGMSCGQIALRELNALIDTYYSSEIDKHAIKQTQLNFPKTIQLGDVTKWQDWNIDFSKIDLILAGSPCQGFSFAGKQLAFDDPRSKLFFVFSDILKYVQRLNPEVKFLLENVRMKKEYERVITDCVGVFPVAINSSLVSAQNRERIYWSNIKVKKVGLFGELHTDIEQPKDRGITLSDILEDEVDEKYILSDKMTKFVSDQERIKKKYSAVGGDKALTLLYSNMNNGHGTHVICHGGCNNTVAGTWRTHKEDYGFRPLIGNKHATVTARSREDGSGQNAIQVGEKIRRLTPRECSRLQTIPEWYKWECSDSQAYKMLGNGWTIEVIKHIIEKWQQ